MNSQRPNPVLRPQFIQGSAGRLFVTQYCPAEPPAERSALLLLPPFADEMNKSRHMLSMLARTVASQGIDCCLVDLFGTGDSEGDFGDSSWDIWCSDVETVYAWLRQQGITSISLLGLRTGALLAAELIHRQLFSVNKLFFWQPVVDGEYFLNQFLRLRLAAQMLDEKQNKSSTAAFRQSLQHGEAMEVAGYLLSPGLAEPLASRKLIDLDVSSLRQICWLELTTREEKSLFPASRTVIEQWQASGVALKTGVVGGAGFWATSEITQVPALIEATLDCLEDAEQ